MTESDLIIGGFYGFIGHDDILVYVGKYDFWYQFVELERAERVHCELLDVDLCMIESRD